MRTTPDTSAPTIAEILGRAMQEHGAGRFEVAEDLYEQALAAEPQNPDALHLMGVLEAQRGNHKQAARLISQAIDLQPQEAMFHNNLGNVWLERACVEDAEACYRQALALAPTRPDVLNNLGVLLSLTGRQADGELLLQRAAELAPRFTDARQNLANHYLRAGRVVDALDQCLKAVLVAPRSRTLRRLLGMLYVADGRIEEATALYRAWLEGEPDSAEARFRLTACTGEDVPDRVPDGFVIETFDGFADSFDAKLSQLSYKAPELVAAAVARHAGTPAQALAVLDAGCGTGLCGPLLKPFASRLVGVDLSAGMLRKAKAREVYDELVAGELVAFLGSRPASGDLLVSADTLCYFGKLETFAAAARTALRDGGLLVFTVESHADEPGEPDFRLQEHGRYSHRRRYVEAVLRGAGMEPVEMQPAVLRSEACKPVNGWVVCARAGLAG